MPERGPERPQVGAPSVAERDELPPRAKNAHRLPSNRRQRALQIALSPPQPLEPNERVFGIAKRSEPSSRGLVTDHQMRVEVDDLVDHAREYLTAGLAPIGAYVEQPDAQRSVVRIQKLGAHLARVEPGRPRPLVRGPLDPSERFVVDEKPALAIRGTDEGGFLLLGEPSVRPGRVKVVETVIAPST